MTIREEVLLGDGVSASYDGFTIAIKGPKGEVSRPVKAASVIISVEGNKVAVEGKKSTKREKTMVGSLAAHIRNLVKGVTQGHQYRLKICSGHFPMNVSVNKGEFVIKNFLGEKFPRVLRIKPCVDVKVEGQEVIVSGSSKELCGQVSADIEKLTSISGRDLRVFQDGIYITDKDGKSVK